MLDRTVVTITLDEIRQKLYADIYEQTAGVVQLGPFKGIQLYPDRSWPESNIAAELLGTFEEELHGDIEAAIARISGLEKPVVVNVGCAEGYYAVGLGRRIPHAEIYAFDIDNRSIQIAANNAKLNNVKFVDGSIADALNRADLVIMDCEGAELDYLDPEQCRGLLKATMIVELHPLKDQTHPIDIFSARFANTHNAKLLVEGPRDPNKFPMLWGRPSIERWLAINESRPCIMFWLVMVPR